METMKVRALMLYGGYVFQVVVKPETFTFKMNLTLKVKVIHTQKL